MILSETYYSIGGGFVVTEAELAEGRDKDDGPPVPYPFKSASEMLEMAASSGKTIADMKRANEVSRGGHDRLEKGLDRIWQVMNDCIDRGLESGGTLPGGLNVRRRAQNIHEALLAERGARIVAVDRPGTDFGALEQALGLLGHHGAEVFGGARHSFTVHGSDDYDLTADQESWEGLLEFLDVQL